MVPGPFLLRLIDVSLIKKPFADQLISGLTLGGFSHFFAGDIVADVSIIVEKFVGVVGVAGNDLCQPLLVFGVIHPGGVHPIIHLVFRQGGSE